MTVLIKFGIDCIKVSIFITAVDERFFALVFDVQTPIQSGEYRRYQRVIYTPIVSLFLFLPLPFLFL